MGRRLRSGKQMPSPNTKNSVKRRIVSIDNDRAPTSEDRVYYSPSDRAHQLGKLPNPKSPPISTVSSGIMKPKSKKSKKPAAVLKAAVQNAGLHNVINCEPEAIVKRRPSSIKSETDSSMSRKLSKSKTVSFDEGKDMMDFTSDGEEYAAPLGAVFQDRITSRRFPRRPSSETPIKTKPTSPKIGTWPKSTTAKPIIDHVEQVVEIDWKLMDQQASDLLESLIYEPRAISLNDISACFYHLQIKTRLWANTHFKFELPEENSIREVWPLHLLKTKYLPLALTTQYIADGSQYGWRRFFTNPESRSCLVYGIVGEYIKQHIFGHTAFGFSKIENVELEKVDKREIHQDGFLRNKERAKMLKTLFDSKSAGERMVELDKQILDLVDCLMKVIEPLLPTEIFNYDVQGQQWHVKDDPKSHEKMRELKDELYEIIAKCTSLHWGIRLTGEEGTVVRIAPPVQKGEQYHEDAPFLCINPDMMIETAHHGGDDKTRVKKIKMTCWGRVEAYIPRGKNHNELSEIEKKYRKTHGMLKQEGVEDEDDISGSDNENENNFQEGRDIEKEGKDKFDWTDVDAWYYASHKEHVNPDPPEEVKQTEMRKYGKKDDEMREFRRPYVQCYRFLSRHDVYCEWEAADKPDFNFNAKIEAVDEEPVSLNGKTDNERRADEKYGIPLPKNERMSLRQAVEQARREREVWKHRLQDTHINVRQHLNKHWGKYELTAYIFAATLFVKSARGLSWEELCGMSPSRLWELVTLYLKKVGRGTTAVRQSVRTATSSAASQGAESLHEVFRLIRQIRKHGTDGWALHWHAKQASTHPWLQKISDVPRALNVTVSRIVTETLIRGNADGQLPAGPKAKGA